MASRSTCCSSAHTPTTSRSAAAARSSTGQEGRIASATWVVLSGSAERGDEARTAAHAFLRGVPRVDVRVEAFRDGYFPHAGPPLKELFESIKGSVPGRT